MARPTQILAPIPEETKDPADALVPTRIVLVRRSFERLVERLRSPGEPAEELRDLMRGDRD